MILPQHGPVLKLHFDSFPIPLPLCTWVITHLRSLHSSSPQSGNATYGLGILELEKLLEMERNWQTSFQMRTWGREAQGCPCCQWQMKNQMGVKTMAMLLGTVGNSPISRVGIDHCSECGHPSSPRITAERWPSGSKSFHNSKCDKCWKGQMKTLV